MEETFSIVIDCIKKVASLHHLKLPEHLDAQTPLMGRQGVFDSLAMVSLIITVEQEIEDRFAKPVKLTDQQAFSQSHSPFLTAGSLAQYAQQRLAELAGAT